MSAATPATCGDAIEVPEIVAGPLPVPTPVETMDTPGPVMSGFNPLSPVRGPPDEKLANALKAGFVSKVGAIDVAGFRPLWHVASHRQTWPWSRVPSRR